jgi:hypothetical protein
MCAADVLIFFAVKECGEEDTTPFRHGSMAILELIEAFNVL